MKLRPDFSGYIHLNLHRVTVMELIEAMEHSHKTTIRDLSAVLTSEQIFNLPAKDQGELQNLSPSLFLKITNHFQSEQGHPSFRK